MPATEPRREGFDEALRRLAGGDPERLLELGLAFGRYRLVRPFAHLLDEAVHRPFLRERALPQVPISGDPVRGFSVDQPMIREIARALDEPVEELLAHTVRRMIDAGVRHPAKLYVFARLSGDPDLIDETRDAFIAPSRSPRRALAERVRDAIGGTVLRPGDDDDYDPKSAHLFAARLDGREVVLKEHLRLAVDPSRLDGYSDERAVLASIDHPAIVPLLDVITVDHHELLVLPRLPVAGTLGRNHIAQIAGALAYLHARSILYLDLKPENLIVDGDRVTLIDFGMARRLAPGESWVRTLPSTPEWAPPEVLRELRASAASDLYQLALLTARLA